MIKRYCRSLLPGLALMLWSLQPVYAKHGPHFTFTANTGTNMTVLVTSTVVPTIDGVPITNGDEIGVFSPSGLCVGAITWDGQSQTLTVWGDNSETENVIDGMAGGEKLNYRIFRYSDHNEVLAFATYNTADPFSRSDSTYVKDGVSVLGALAGISAPAAPTLTAPADGATAQSISLSLSWNTLATASSYSVQISTSSSFLSTVFNRGNIAAGQVVPTGLLNARTYYWRVNATNAGGTGTWSSTRTFSTITHFTSISGTGTNMIVLLKSGVVPTIDGVPVATGDEIGVFTASGLCVGSTVWDGSAQTITVWGDNSETEAVDGMSANETLLWRLFSPSIGSEVRAFATYNTTDPFARSSSKFVQDGVSILATLPGYTVSSCSVSLDAGWNMKSFNVAPLDSTSAAVFGSPASFLMVKDAQGNPWCPQVGLQDLSVVHTGLGYQIYSGASYTLSVTGIPLIPETTPIPLHRGWNMIAYLPSQNINAETALSGIVSKVVIVKNNGGDAFIPSIPINDIGLMKVGEGYQIYVTDSVVLTYSSGISKRMAGNSMVLKLPATRHFAKHKNTGSNATIVASSVLIDGVPVNDGCEIGAYDAAGNLVGAGSVLQGCTAFAVWGADEVDKENAGLQNDGEIKLALWDGTSEHPVHFADGIGRRYQANAFINGSLCASSGTRISQFNLSKVYPNPFRSAARIAFEVPSLSGASNQHVEISVFDLKGNLVQTLAKGNYAPGSYSVDWNGAGDRHFAGLGSSLYVVRMNAAGFEKKIKLIKVK